MVRLIEIWQTRSFERDRWMNVIFLRKDKSNLIKFHASAMIGEGEDKMKPMTAFNMRGGRL